MRKGRDGGEKWGKKWEKKKKKRLMKIVATTSLPAVDRPNADRWNVARSCQKNSLPADWKRKKGRHAGGQTYVLGGMSLQKKCTCLKDLYGYQYTILIPYAAGIAKIYALVQHFAYGHCHGQAKIPR